MASSPKKIDFTKVTTIEDVINIFKCIPLYVQQPDGDSSEEYVANYNNIQTLFEDEA